MTFDWHDIADAVRLVLIASGVAWLFIAWLHRTGYRRTILVLAAFVVIDWLLHAFANWMDTAETPIPADFSAFELFALGGALTGLAVARWRARPSGISPTLLLDGALVTVLAGGIGARLYHVLVHWDFYSQHGEEINNLAQGGMGLRGGIAFGLVALFLFSVLRRVSFRKLGDLGALWLAPAAAFGWYGAHLVGANYGIESDLPLAQDLPDIYGILAPRIPVQLIAALLYATLFAVLLALSLRGVRPGVILSTFLLAFGLGNFALDALRGDASLFWYGLRIDQWADLGAIALGLALAVTTTRPVAPFRLPRAAPAPKGGPL
jgi:phosphatidylglycerol:prolipoprotein diacylglycerol transferase